MVILLIAIVLFSLLIVASEYNWKGVLLFTIVVGFLQDPIRKLSETDSSYFSLLSLTCFLVAFLLLKERHTLWYIPYICWTNPKVISLIPIFFYLILLQAVNSFSRFGDLTLSIAGILFYILPLTALWVGFHIGTDPKLLRTFMISYLIACTIFAMSILVSLSGFNSVLLKEVGGGLLITGLDKVGQSGLWRTSEIAGWHLAAGACFSLILGVTEEKNSKQYIYFFLSIGLTILSTTTGRRKALGMVILFISLFLLYYSYNVNGSKVTRIFTALALVGFLSFSTYEFLLSTSNQEVLDPYLDRSSTLTIEETQGRFGGQGIGAFLRGLEIAGPFGYGVGAGVNAGSTGIGKSREDIRSLGYVVEGGGGRIVAELGSIGIAILAYLLFNVGVLFIRNIRLANLFLPVNSLLPMMGLLIFTSVNIINFFSASQVYNDLFILILIGISSGTFLSVPILASRHQTSYSITDS
jgi:hypothetical protein